MVRTRFAPSPTGFLHIGGARTALFSWAYARCHGGKFILRIEDSDVARSTSEAVEGILQAMDWLGLDYDEGPFYQQQRMERYREVIAQMLDEGSAYHCYTSPEELEAMREAQRARGEKAKYDGRWRPEPGKILPPPPAGVLPVVRFKNPLDGSVAWNDRVKGRIAFCNTELDDLIIARQDGTPTYNFCVVVDDWDMQITHIIRGDDHVNNTPRQINILRALGAPVPEYAHVSMILGDDGQKLSKRHGAVNVMEYEADGYLPQALTNYLARLGWSHGDDEIFSMEQFRAWFDLDHITPSAAQFNTEKLDWLNAHYLKTADDEDLVRLVRPRLAQIPAGEQPPLAAVMALYKERVANLNELANEAAVFYTDAPTSPESCALCAQHLDEQSRPALAEFIAAAREISWEAPAINALIKQTITRHNLKMPRLAMPMRVLLTGRAQTPSVDALLALFPREMALERLERGIGSCSL
ncbi:MAG: glutamate--tRNA ligase [Betaproteobacteria bacterium]|nr:glutamate--tRNA ligase [Betaproteobacteria bacterium]